jgi:hypothetical protein
MKTPGSRAFFPEILPSSNSPRIHEFTLQGFHPCTKRLFTHNGGASK